MDIPAHLEVARPEILHAPTRARPLLTLSSAGPGAIFQGPQACASPSWSPARCGRGVAVPTWNGTVAHAGRP
jgi:predicted FMN-binding regulatory protein PaiB